MPITANHFTEEKWCLKNTLKVPPPRQSVHEGPCEINAHATESNVLQIIEKSESTDQDGVLIASDTVTRIGIA